MIRIDLLHELVRRVDFQMIAVGEDRHRTRPGGLRFIAVRPEESSFQNNFFLGLALRFVEIGGRFRNAKDVAAAVIADAVARAKIGVRVVIGGAPADSAGITIVACQLIVHARMPPDMLRYQRNVVESLGGKHVAVELRVQVRRMIGQLQRKAEIVDGEDVFEPLGVAQVADASGLARVVQRVC